MKRAIRGVWNLFGGTMAGLGLLLMLGCRPAPHLGERYQSVEVLTGEIEQRVTANGSLGAVVSVDVGSQVSGKIAMLAADYNSVVKKGDLIAQIDPIVYEATLRQAQGELASAEANAMLKRQNLARKKAMLPARASSQLDLDLAVAELSQAEAAVVIREALVASAKANLGYCRITAPVDGVVIARRVDVGQTVIAAMTTPVLFTIAQNLESMNINASISESDIGWVKKGQPVAFTVDAYPEEIFKGVVAQVRKSPTTLQNVVTYETVISLENAELKLYPGMTAEVAILVSKRENILKVPNSALRLSPPVDAEFEAAPPGKYGRNQRLVYVLGAGLRTLRPALVRVGISDGVDSEILDGLLHGDRVVVGTLWTKEKSGGFIPKSPPKGPE